MKEKKNILFFLGAGCSWPVIPLARDIVNCLRKSNNKELLSGYDQLNYEHEVTQLMDADSDRQAYFRKLCRDAKPTKVHMEFAKLIDELQSNGQVPLILTTNFDSVLERALGKADIEHDVYDLDSGKPAELQSTLKNAEGEGRLIVVKLLGSAKGKGAVQFNLRHGREVGTALVASLPATTRVVVAGYSGAESGVADMFSTLFFGDRALDPKNLYWCTAPNEGPPFEDPRNVVFRTMKEKLAKWVKDATFAAAVVQLGGDSDVLADDVAEASSASGAPVAAAAAAAPAAAAATAPRTASRRPVGHVGKKRRLSVTGSRPN